MKIGVPGEFHEARWQRTAEDSERRVLPRTREVCRTIRIQVIAWRGGLVAGLRHGSHDHRYLSAISAWRRGTSGRSSARPAVSIFGERGDTLRPARTSAYSAPGNTSHRSGARHIQWAPAYSESARRFSRARRRRGMDPRHIHRVPGISRARRHRRMAPRHIQCAPGISRARRRRGCRLCPSHRRGCCRSGWRGWSG